jgi:predicted nucleic acid-binding protein
VLQELFVTLTKKTAPPLSPAEARAVVSDMATWQVVVPAAADVVDAIDAAARWQISFWDAMLLTTARKAQAETLWSEDLNDGQDYDGVVVRNPFRGQPVSQSR